MESINYNEFQAGQGVSAPALNENFTLTNNAIENLYSSISSAIGSVSSLTQSKAEKNGSSVENFYVADATQNYHAVNLKQLNESISTLTPTGTVIWYANNNLPDGYLVCDGSAISRTAYTDLFSVIGTTFGVGDSSTTFNLPNLIDKFVEGSSTVGTYYEAGLPDHRHTYTAVVDGPYQIGVYEKGYTRSSTNTGYASVSDPIYGNSDTVQPEALTLLPCIKY